LIPARVGDACSKCWENGIGALSKGVEIELPWNSFRLVTFATNDGPIPADDHAAVVVAFELPTPNEFIGICVGPPLDDGDSPHAALAQPRSHPFRFER